MKLRKTIVVAAASTLLLAGCTTDKKEVKAYDENVQKAFDKEQSINEVSKKLNSLEEKKIAMTVIHVVKQLTMYLIILINEKKPLIRKFQF